MLRRLSGLEYECIKKPVKNLNLRVRRDGSLSVSAPIGTSKAQIDAFVLSKADWIENARLKLSQQQSSMQDPPRFGKQECLEAFGQISMEIYPLFAHVLHHPPILQVRSMKTRWGVCHIQKRQIVLNRRLLEKPKAAIEYVILHEYMHFLHPNHQQGFHAAMFQMMPDYKQRRKLLL